MTVRRPILVAVLAGLIALAIMAALGAGTRGGSTERAAQQPTSPASLPSASAKPGASSTASSDAPPGGDGAVAAPSPTPSSKGGASTSKASTGAEIPSDANSAGSGLPGLRQAARQRRASEAELRAAFPELEVRRAALVADHPRRTVPVPHRAEVQSSSLATEDGITQVAVVIDTPGSVDRALRFYRIRLGRVGFTEGDAPTVASGAAASFRRRPDTAVVTADRRDGNTVVTVYATLRTGA